MPLEKDDKIKGNMPTFETCDFSTQKTKGNMPKSERADFFYYKTKGNMPTSETNDFFDDKTEGCDIADAIGYMEGDENKDPEPETKVIPHNEDPEPMIPLSEDCVVVFGSMAGKYTHFIIILLICTIYLD